MEDNKLPWIEKHRPENIEDIVGKLNINLNLLNIN